MLPITPVLGTALFVFALSRILAIGRRPKNYPPGPPTLPVLGNLHQMPTRDAHLQFEKWAREYGPIYSLMLGTKCMILLSSDETVKDLLDKRSAIYSDRLEMYIGQTICSGGLRLLMMAYGPTWRMFRKMIHGLLNVSVSSKYISYQMLENRQMLYEILTEPDDFLMHIRRYSNALTTTMLFGWRTPTYENMDMMQLFDGFNRFTAINQTGMAVLIDFFPWLRRLPDFLLPVRREGKEMHKREKALYRRHWLRAKEEAGQGTLNDCFCAGMAEAQKRHGFSDDQAAYVSGTLLEAGSDTTSNQLYAFVQAMLLFPEVQRKAQAVIDEVVGASRMPVMDDLSDLQYIRACMKETLRWMPTANIGGAPHAVTQDDEYKGYFIPKGAGVFNNVWAIHMDPSRHPNPRTFDPDRYRDDRRSLGDAAVYGEGSQRDVFTFGAGRRLCPGVHVAERSLFLGMSRILWAFHIEPALDAAGQPIIPDANRLTQGFVCMPEEFPAKITPRSPARAEMVRAEWARAQEECLDRKTEQWRTT
ncbi:hypothetical protein N7492_008130 [Penicillium capsulatum]|uniref:Cytochrome P450 n=1 Tax=Penicillium capsulatum TaxID=69766 RepID=A0A9W9HR73_9EURO|nr:hypothetical protein N7492_008130 [Penicillium capsulatum]KAJ6105541.1 hypothetical protein N7512_009058 [Penicillium capsulatum]